MASANHVVVVVGSKMWKQFDTEWHSDVVTVIDAEQQTSKRLFHVMYDDGDEEDLYQDEVQDIVVNATEDPPSPTITETENDSESSNDDEYSMRTPLIMRVPDTGQPHYRFMSIPEADRHHSVFCLPGDRTTGDRRASLDADVTDVVLVLCQTFYPVSFIIKLNDSTTAYAEHNLTAL